MDQSKLCKWNLLKSFFLHGFKKSQTQNCGKQLLRFERLQGCKFPLPDIILIYCTTQLVSVVLKESNWWGSYHDYSTSYSSHFKKLTSSLCIILVHFLSYFIHIFPMFYWNSVHTPNTHTPIISQSFLLTIMLNTATNLSYFFTFLSFWSWLSWQSRHSFLSSTPLYHASIWWLFQQNKTELW